MGWENSHLHDFRKGKQLYGRPNPDERFFNARRMIDDREVRLDDVLLSLGSAGAPDRLSSHFWYAFSARGPCRRTASFFNIACDPQGSRRIR
jgi:hypothetical protein